MKSRRINRGLVLGGVLLIAAAGYSFYEKVQFEKSEQQIQSTAESYIRDMMSANVAAYDEGSTEPLKAFVEKYWLSSEPSNDFYGESVTRGEALAAADSLPLSFGDIESSDVFVNNISVKKYGSCANVTLDFSACIRCSGEPQYFNGMQAEIYYEMDSYYPYEETPDTAMEAGARRDVTIRYTQLEIILKPVDGEWKVIETADVMGFYPESTQFVDDDGENSAEEVQSDGE